MPLLLVRASASSGASPQHRCCLCKVHEHSALLSSLAVRSLGWQRVPFSPACTSLLPPASSSLELQTRGFESPQSGRFGGTLLREGVPFFCRSPALPDSARRSSPLLPSGTGSSPLASRRSYREEAHGVQPQRHSPSTMARRAPLSAPSCRGCGPCTKAGEPPVMVEVGVSRCRSALSAQLSALPSRLLLPLPRSAAAGRTPRRAGAGTAVQPRRAGGAAESRGPG